MHDLRIPASAQRTILEREPSPLQRRQRCQLARQMHRARSHPRERQLGIFRLSAPLSIRVRGAIATPRVRRLGEEQWEERRERVGMRDQPVSTSVC